MSAARSLLPSCSPHPARWRYVLCSVLLAVGVMLLPRSAARAQTSEGWAALRGAGAGAWSFGMGWAGDEGNVQGEDAQGTGWCAMIRAGSGSDFRTSFEVGVILHPGWRGILGLQWDRGTSGSMTVGLKGARAHGRLVLPVVQPAARPSRPVITLGTPFEAWRGSSGRAMVSWSAGGFPRLMARVCGPPWCGGVGSTGAWLSWFPRNAEGPGLSFTVGLLRSSIPWVGLDWGSSGWVGSDPGEWPFQYWFE